MDGETIHFTATTAGGVTLEADVLVSDNVLQLREAFEKLHEVPAGAYFKLIQGAQVLLDSTEVASLETTQPLFAVVTRETRLEILLQAAGRYAGYAKLLGEAPEPVEGQTEVMGLEPFPTILDVLEQMSGEPAEMEHLKPASSPSGHEGLLQFAGDDGDLILPSLDLLPLLTKLKVEQLKRATISIRVNSDAYNRGLGVVLEASKLLDATADDSGLPVYLYNGYGLNTKNRGNVVKFHPGMGGGAMRVEGAGGWGNQDVGFTPASWSASGTKLHTLEVTFATDGTNEVVFRGTEEGQLFSKSWTRKLFDGRHLPAVYAWLDLGGQESGTPLMIGRIALTAHLQ